MYNNSYVSVYIILNITIFKYCIRKRRSIEVYCVVGWENRSQAIGCDSEPEFVGTPWGWARFYVHAQYVVEQCCSVWRYAYKTGMAHEYLDVVAEYVLVDSFHTRIIARKMGTAVSFLKHNQSINNNCQF